MSTSSTADIINDSIKDPLPAIQTPLSTEVTLLRGLRDTATDTWHTEAVVRELNGADEEYLAGLAASKKGLTITDYMNHLLSRAVLEIGTLDVKKLGKDLFGKLIVADRDMLFLGIMRATYGDAKEFRINCPHCAASNDVSINLDDDFPMRTPTFDVRQPIVVKIRNGFEVQLRLPTGEDIATVQASTKNEAELNNRMLARCIVNEDIGDKLEWVLQLKLPDQRKLVNTLLDVVIGPDLEGVKTQCATCEETIPLQLDWVSLLLG